MTTDDWPPMITGMDLSLTRAAIHRSDSVMATLTAEPPADTFDGTMGRLAEHAWQIVGATPRHGLIVMEDFAYGRSNTSTSLIYGLGWLVRYMLWMNDHPIALVTPQQLKMYATGKGTAGKDEVMLAAARRWPDVPIENNDQADAFVLWAMGWHHTTGQAWNDVDLPATHTRALEKVRWP